MIMEKLFDKIYYEGNQGILSLARTGEKYKKAKQEYEQFRDDFERLLLNSLKPELDQCIMLCQLAEMEAGENAFRLGMRMGVELMLETCFKE